MGSLCPPLPPALPLPRDLAPGLRIQTLRSPSMPSWGSRPPRCCSRARHCSCCTPLSARPAPSLRGDAGGSAPAPPWCHPPHPARHSLHHAVVVLSEAVPASTRHAGGRGVPIDVLVPQAAQVLPADLQGLLHQLGGPWPCCGWHGVRDMAPENLLCHPRGQSTEPPHGMGGFGCVGMGGWGAEHP